MALYSSVRARCLPSILTIQHKLLQPNKCSNNVLVQLYCRGRGPHLAAGRASLSHLTDKCLTPDVEQVVLVEGLKPTTLSPPNKVKRSDFDTKFLFGASSSALQTEGSGSEGGRGPSTWDDMIQAGQGMKAVDSYNLYKEDFKLLKDMGMTAYRFSIAWPRILPNGTPDDINEDGIAFYDKFINELLKYGIEPVVTLFHFDLPVALQNKYKGFLSESIIEDFKNYADLCFEKFGDRVKMWGTINEPFVFGSYGYKMGLPAEDASNPQGPFIATHNIILAHAAVADLYCQKYKRDQKGKIGISLPSKYFEPYSTDPLDVEAAKLLLDFELGWYMDPFIKGQYPVYMKQFVKGLPEFSEAQKEQLKTSWDYIGLNYYTARFAKHSFNWDSISGKMSIEFLEKTVNYEGVNIGEQAQGQDRIFVNPEGLRKLLLHIKDKYNNPEVYVTENGVPATPPINRSVKDSIEQGKTEELEMALFDDYRIKHAEDHLVSVREAIREGADVKGYFVWSLMDNMEVGAGYSCRFGLNYIDYYNNHMRYPKLSALWFKKFLQGKQQQENRRLEKDGALQY